MFKAMERVVAIHGGDHRHIIAHLVSNGPFYDHFVVRARTCSYASVELWHRYRLLHFIQAKMSVFWSIGDRFAAGLDLQMNTGADLCFKEKGEE
jgi:hypothetical protein